MKNNRYFQYIAGSRIGDVVIFDGIESDEDLVFVCFKDGERCNENLILPLNERNPGSAYMAEVENATNIWKFNTEWKGRQEERTELNEAQVRVIVQPAIAGRQVITPIPPRKTNSNFGAITKHVEPVIVEPSLPVIDDPVDIMVLNSKKFETEVSLDMIIFLPKKNLYSIIEESFNGGDKMIEYIINNIDINLSK